MQTCGLAASAPVVPRLRYAAHLDTQCAVKGMLPKGPKLGEPKQQREYAMIKKLKVYGRCSHLRAFPRGTPTAQQTQRVILENPLRSCTSGILTRRQGPRTSSQRSCSPFARQTQGHLHDTGEWNNGTGRRTRCTPASPRTSVFLWKKPSRACCPPATP